MSALSDRSIRAMLASGRIDVDPLDDGAVQPASVDLRLGERLLLLECTGAIDPLTGRGADYVPVPVDEGGAWWTWPGNLYLGVTLERVRVPADVVGLLHGRSTLGRYGITVHQTAGLIDPGWDGPLTLEIVVAKAARLRPGMPIGQLVLVRLTTPAEAPYGDPSLRSAYQGGERMTPRPLGERGGAS